MSKAVLSAEQFISEFQTLGAKELAKKYGMQERDVYSRRRRLEARHDISLAAPTKQPIEFPGRVPLSIKNGSVLIGSDFHIWPGEESTCLRAFKKLCDDLKPSAVILNGDVLDFSRISRHPALNWGKSPDPQEEIEAAQDHLDDIVKRCKRGAQKIWTIGNHDLRFEASIANALPQFRGVKGVSLGDHFPLWQKAMSCMINYEIESARTMVKHRLAGGVHATYSNVKKAGTHIVTGHLHSQNVRCVSDYRDFDLYGVDTGCVADKNHRAFAYAEDNPLDWRSGFALLTYRDGWLLYPELVTKFDENSVQFRGQVIRV